MMVTGGSNNNSYQPDSSTILLCSANVWGYSGSSPDDIMKHIYNSIKSNLSLNNNIETIIIGFQEDICEPYDIKKRYNE